jgi:hypothetical protein
MDSPEVAVARYASQVSYWSLILSGSSFCIAFSVFLLELRRWFDEGVRLSMSMIVDAKFSVAFNATTIPTSP